MDYINDFLSQYSSAQMFFAYCMLLFLTLLGTLPSNSDITIIAGSLLVGVGKFELFPFVLAVVGIVMFTENLTFFTGYFWGKKIKRWRIVQKVIPETKQVILENHARTNAFKVLFTIRMTPLLRPIFYMLLGSLRLRPKTFWRYHTPILLLYLSVLIFISIVFGNLVQTYLTNYKEYIFAGVLLLCIFMIRLNFRTKSH